LKRGALLAICSACAIGPHLVSAPMLSSVPVPVASADAAPEEVASSDNPGEPAITLAGSWSGRAWQSGNKSWPLEVTFESHVTEVTARVHYPDQRCRAEWHLRSTRPKQWIGEETVRTDPFNRCPNHGRVTVVWTDESSIQWSWSGSGGSASARLERTQP